MTAGGYSPRSIGNYVREMRFIFEYYPDTRPSAITADQVEKYICYIKQVFNSGQVLRRPLNLLRLTHIAPLRK